VYAGITKPDPELDLGVLRRETGDYPAAAQPLDQALGIFPDLGHRASESWTPN
jgi:hypothetical protein